METSLFSYGKTAMKLVTELHRQNRLLNNPFDHESVHKVKEEIIALFRKTESDLETHRANNSADLATSYIQSELYIYYHTFQRNKRCLLAYLYERLRLIEKLRWELCSTVYSEEIMKCLSPEEKEYKEKYCNLLAAYTDGMPNIDLSLNMTMPPFKLKVDVLVIQDYDTIMSNDGTPITLKKDTVVRMKRNEAETLIKNGIVKLQI